MREEVNKRSKEKEELEKELEEIRLKIRKKESTVIDFEIIKKGFEGFYRVYPSLEPNERQALARLFIKEVKIFNDKVDIEFLEFPELAHQDPVQILKEPSIRGAIFIYEGKHKCTLFISSILLRLTNSISVQLLT